MHRERRAKMEKPRLGSMLSKLTGEGTRDVPVEVLDATEPVVLREESQEGELPDLADIPAANEEEAQSAPPSRDEELFVSDGSDQAFETTQMRKTPRQAKEAIPYPNSDTDDKKKLALSTSYDGFSIYGRILCLIVKRRGIVKGKDVAGGANQAMMEEWIASTQIAEGQMMED